MPIKYAKPKYTPDMIFSESSASHVVEGEYYPERRNVMAFFNECFDMSDKDTRARLISMNEADHSKVLTSLTVRLYDHIVKKTDRIDFGEIPKTKGDMKKLSNYDDLIECLEIIRGMLVEYKENTAPVDQISLAAANIVGRKDKFMVAFSNNAEFPIMLYNVTVLGIYASLSYIIASCIEFIKKPRDDAFEISLDRVAYAKSKDYILFDCLAKFNAGCADGTIDRCIEATYKTKKLNNSMQNIHEASLGAIIGAAFAAASKEARKDSTGFANKIASDTKKNGFTLKNFASSAWENTKKFVGNHKVFSVIIGIILFIILLRGAIYYFYNLRMKFSDYCAIQASLIEMNASNIEYNNTINQEKKNDIIDKQMKWAAAFKKLSNFFAISSKKAEVQAQREIDADETDSELTIDIEDNEDEDEESVSALF